MGLFVFSLLPPKLPVELEPHFLQSAFLRRHHQNRLVLSMAAAVIISIIIPFSFARRRCPMQRATTSNCRRCLLLLLPRATSVPTTQRYINVSHPALIGECHLAEKSLLLHYRGRRRRAW